MQRLITGRITLYFHNEPRAKKKGSAGRSWPAGRSLDTPALYQLDTSRYISKNNHYLIITNVSVSLLFVFMGKALDGMAPSLCGKQVMGPSSQPVVVDQSDERHANRA